MLRIYDMYQYISGARGGAVGWGTALQVRRSRVRFPMVLLEFCIDIILPGHTAALGLTQPLREMSTRNISWGVKVAGAYGWQPYHLNVPIVLKSRSLNLLELCGLVMGLLYLFTNTYLNQDHKIKQQRLESQNTTKLYYIYRAFQEECARLQESVPYVKVYRYNPKHLCPKLNGYGDNGQRKVWSSGGSTHCTCQLTSLIDVYPWVWCPITESQLTLAYSRLIPECAVTHVTSVLAFMCHV